MVGFTDQSDPVEEDEGDRDYQIVEVTAEVSRKKQIEEFEPFTVTETLRAKVPADADIDAVSEELHDTAKEHVQRDLMKRVEEKEMKDQLEGN